MKINAGSGGMELEGYENVDLYRPCNHPDDIRTLATFANHSADEILASHSLEHLGRDEAQIALRRWREVLKPGGRLTVIVPDVPQQIRLWLEWYERCDACVWGFRSQTIWGNQVYPGEFHLWGYDERSLRHVLSEAGFTVHSIEYVEGFDLDLGVCPTACLRAEATA